MGRILDVKEMGSVNKKTQQHSSFNSGDLSLYKKSPKITQTSVSKSNIPEDHQQIFQKKYADLEPVSLIGV